VLTVDRRTFPLDSPKVRAIGHGIDLAEFSCGDGAAVHADLRVVALGRYSKAKGLEVVLRAVRLALDGGLDVRLEAYGPALNPEERAHRAELERLVEELDLSRRVKLGHAVLRSEVPGLLSRADALVNNMRAGATDKVVYEACASCRPAIASNPAFDSLLPDELRFEREDARGLADRLLALGAESPDQRLEVGRSLRARVAASHSVESWADGVVEAAR
jgi:glycosyltransferase involved in cell wall biosynthesis